MTKHFIYIAFISLLFLNSSCNSKKKSVKDNTTENKTLKTNQTQESNFTVLLKGSHSNFEKPSLKVIKNNDELKQLFGVLNSTKSPSDKIPEVQFNKNIVVGLFMGTKNSSGFSIEINHIDYKPDETVIEYRETTPKGRVMTVMTSPFQLAKINRTNTPIKFQKID